MTSRHENNGMGLASLQGKDKFGEMQIHSH